MKMQPPTVIDMVLHQRYVPRSRYYFCSGHQHLGSAEENFNHEQQAPFILPLNNKLYAQSHNSQPRKLQQRRKSPHKITDNYHALQSSDILHRLHVEETKDTKTTSEPIIAVTDIDPQYFTELSNQVIDERFSLNQLITDTKDILRTKILIELKKDKCNRIDQLISKESRILSQAEEDFLLFKIGFDDFLSENHDETIRVKEELEKEAYKTQALEVKLARLTEQSKTIQREIYNLEQPLKQQKMCQRFLYKVSPELWRAEQDDKPSVELDDDKFIDKTVSMIEIKPPRLYFREPSELIRIFNAIGMQKLNALTQLDLLSETIEQMEKIADKTQSEVDEEIQKIRKQIEKLEMSISFMKNHADNLQKYTTHNLNQVLNALIKSNSTLVLQAEIEEAYKKCVGSIDGEMSDLEMMKAIEQTCENLNVQLDKFPKDVVLSCVYEFRKNKWRLLRMEADAEKEEKRMNRLMIILKRMMEPAKQPTRRIMSRSDPPAPKEEKVRPPEPLTEEEIMYLDLFTKCTKYDVDIADRALVPVELIEQMNKGKMSKSTKQERNLEQDFLF